jgi:hypothetical protein
MATDFRSTRNQIVPKQDADALMVRHGNAALNSTAAQTVNTGEAKELMKRHGTPEGQKRVADMIAEQVANAVRRRGATRKP